MTDRIAVIGAGPAGILAALAASERGIETHLFDLNPRIGRKLMVSGAGRCNLSHASVSARDYYTSHPEELKLIFSNCSELWLCALLEKYGIFTYQTEDGWLYPLSNSAANVVDIFEARLEAQGIKFHGGCSVEALRKGKDFQIIIPGQKDVFATRVILASGGKAYPTLGSKGQGYELLKPFGHSVYPVLPALAPLETDPHPFHKLQGVRMDAEVALFENERLLARTSGNMIFTEWGLNGPAVMNISHLVSLNAGKTLDLEINFLAEWRERLERLLHEPSSQKMPLKAILEAFLPAKVVVLFMQKSEIPLDTLVSKLAEQKLENILKQLTHARISVRGVRGFDFAQVCTGGIPLTEVYPSSLESRLVPGLYLAGELLDVCGPCGGYNLHWAFCSGYIAGCSAGEKCYNERSA